MQYVQSVCRKLIGLVLVLAVLVTWQAFLKQWKRCQGFLCPAKSGAAPDVPNLNTKHIEFLSLIAKRLIAECWTGFAYSSLKIVV